MYKTVSFLCQIILQERLLTASRET
jgi:hypothetical protein